MILRGWALVGQGQGEEGIAQLREGLVAYRATGADLECSHWLALLAEAYSENGQSREGLSVIADAINHVAQTGIVNCDAKVHRIVGQLQLSLDTPDQHTPKMIFR